MQAIVDSTAV